MADAKVLEFFQRAESDPELRARVQSVKVTDHDTAFAELARIANESGYAVSAEALAIGLQEAAAADLSDAELDAVTGGTGVLTSPTLAKPAIAKPAFTTLKTSPTFISFTKVKGIVAPDM